LRSGERVNSRIFIAELSRRRVFRALVVYGIGAFAVLQIIEPIMHGLHWPDAVLSYVIVALALGFPVVVGLAWVFDVNAGRIERSPSIAPTGGLRGVRLAVMLAGIGLLAAVPGVLYYFVLRGAGATAGGKAASGATSIAVLPFVNMSGEKENEYFSDGITEELINALANIEGLRVASRTAAFSLKGRNLGIRQIGDELNVTTFLEGSIRREGNALRVTAQLISVSDGYHLWSKSYDRELKSIFALEDEIARSIAESLQRRLVRGVAVTPPTTSLEAHDLYLRGRYFWNRRSVEALRKAAGYFEQAIQQDPGYALAYAGLADAIALRLDYDQVLASEIAPRAKAAALRALELDPALAEAHTSLGNLSAHEYDWPAAIREFRTATELKPDYATAHQWYAEALASMGRLQEARAEVDRALQVDPTSLIINDCSGFVSYLGRDYERALAEFKKTLEMDPGFDRAYGDIAGVYAAQARYAEALAELDKMHLMPATALQSNRAYIHALAGHRSEALRLLRDLEESAKREYVLPASLATVWAALGDKDRAFALLKKACAEHDSTLLWLKVDPSWDTLRSDPRFKELLACIHLD
jgi:TolB-like protein/Flp pilus assembly protein TadD